MAADTSSPEARESAPAFTVLLPVHRPPDLLRFSLESVQRQTRQDFEVFVICDGAPRETAEEAERIAADDQRVRVFDHPQKGARHGELYRAQALAEARGRFVCHIADDDLWLPQHLAAMEQLLRRYDFGHSLNLVLNVDGHPDVWFLDLASEQVQRRMLDSLFNVSGITACGYRLDAYRKLPDGWAPAPEDTPTDLHMWRKFIAHPEIGCGTGFHVSTLVLPMEGGQTLADRAKRMADLAEKTQDLDWLERLIDRALSEKAALLLEQDEAMKSMEDEIGFLKNELMDSGGSRQQLKAELDVARRELAAVKASTSWKVTGPLRFLASKARRGKAR
jgi:glycosyltransferase involved in cell wall biosynthesis